VSDRIENFASIVGPERVIASTDCGFGTFIYLTVPEQLAYAKLKTLTEGAALAACSKLQSRRAPMEAWP